MTLTTVLIAVTLGVLTYGLTKLDNKINLTLLIERENNIKTQSETIRHVADHVNRTTRDLAAQLAHARKSVELLQEIMEVQDAQILALNGQLQLLNHRMNHEKSPL
jgi:hypothetical protein